MKLDFLTSATGWLKPAIRNCKVESETHRLTDVLLCRPSFLEPVPCCSVTIEHLRKGTDVSAEIAVAQHERLQATLERHGVRCHLVPPDEGMPDMCFTRDVLLGTPWGLMALRPSAPHRTAGMKLIVRCAMPVHWALRWQRGFATVVPRAAILRSSGRVW